MQINKICFFVLLVGFSLSVSEARSEAKSEEKAHESGGHEAGVEAAHHGEEASHSDHLEEQPARKSSRDVMIPKDLVTKIEKSYRKFQSSNNFSSTQNIKRQFLNVSVELTQKPGAQALFKNVRVLTPFGGGVIDLADFVSPLRGSFAVRFVVKKEDGSEVEGLNVGYVSHTKKLQIKKKSVGSEKSVGSGCDVYMDLTSYILDRNKKHGLELYTIDQRYLSVIGGTFVLYAFAKEALYIGSATFVDSRFPDRSCDHSAEGVAKL